MSEFEARQRESDTVRLEAELAKAKRTIKAFDHAEKEQAKAIARLERELGLLERIGVRDSPPGWLARTPRSTRKHHGTPCLMLSDLHLDEVVEAPQVMGMNAYNRKIAELRLEQTFQNFVTCAADYWTGVTYDGAVCVLAGDIFSGIIHEELSKTNEDYILSSVDYWIDPLAVGIELLAETFGKVYVPVVVGNHGRMTRKPVHKGRARDNFDWFIGRALARMFRNDRRVTFEVSESPDLLFNVYGTRIMATHGDQTSGGGGIGGIWPPIMRMNARKQQRQAAVNLPYDLLVMGHWHQLTLAQQFIINGSLKGYDEYAFDMNFGFEVPQQAMWLVVPEHGVTWRGPVFCQDKEREGW